MNAPSPDPFGTVHRTADLRGLQCPLPVLKAGRRLRDMASGERLLVLTDDPLAGLDVPNFCREAGHELVAQKAGEAEHELHFVIERAG